MIVARSPGLIRRGRPGVIQPIISPRVGRMVGRPTRQPATARRLVQYDYASAGALWEGATGSFTFSGADITSSDANYRNIRVIDDLLIPSYGDFELTFTYQGSSDHLVVGVYPSSQDGSFAANSAGAGVNYQYCGVGNYIGGSQTEYYINNESNVAESQAAAGTVFKVERKSGIFACYKNGTIKSIGSTKDVVALRIVLMKYDNAGTSCDIDSVNWSIWL